MISTRGSWGTILVGGVGVIVALAIWLVSRRNPVSAKNINDEPEAAQPALVAA
ncbi:MAG TPA: hypothetical protein VG674_00400 [Amycolatopsis sp.]|nr:hypothetical protein [Amycolatopsis sp.]